MRLRHPGGRTVHLSYGTSPRPLRNLPAAVRRLDTYAMARARLGVDCLGIDLWLPPALAALLAVDGRARARLRADLDARRLDVVTVSGTPLVEGGGETGESGPGVGGEGCAPAGDVPGWNEPARREYTLDLARILVDLLPDEAVRGAVRTTGLAPRADWTEAEEKATTGILRRLSAGLADLAWQNGRAVRVGFQPGPGLVLDTAEETVAALSRIDKDRLGVCLDLTHLTRTWPDPVAGIEAITDAGLPVIEARLTAAPGTAVESWRAVLRHLFGAAGPQTEYLIVAPHLADPTPEQIASDVTYLLAELSSLGLAPENEACAAR
jgi:hypothetical protein